MEQVKIKDREYLFNNKIRENEIYRESFLDLAKDTFEIFFRKWYERGFWGDNYIPYVLIDKDKVVANVSINLIKIEFKGENKKYLQIGTVMTDKEYRKKGLANYLMERVLEEWKDKVDGIYLYANDEVYDFYPRYGFIEAFEYEYSKEISNEDYNTRKINPKRKKDLDLILDLYKKSNPYSDLSMVENPGLIMFYLDNFLFDEIVYIEEYKALVVREFDDEAVIVYDIFMEEDRNINLDMILKKVAAPDSKKVILGFTPKNRGDFSMNRYSEEGMKLFIQKDGENIFENDKIILPLLSRA